MRTIHAGLVASLIIALAPAAQAAPKVLICASDGGTGGVADVTAKLKASMQFDAVDNIDCGKSTPTLQQLKMYEAVLTFTGGPWADAAGLGNVFADYVDAGGGVVNMLFTLVSQLMTNFGGRWAQGGYDCINPGQLMKGQSPTKAMPNDPNSPIVMGIGGYNPIYYAGGGLNQAKGAVSVWDYQNGAPAVCKMTHMGHERVDLNFLPGPMFYTENKMGDATNLIKNALLFVSGGFNPLKAMPSPVAFPDTGTGAISNAITVNYTNTSMMAQTVNSAVIAGANPGDFLIVKVPQLPLQVGSMGTIALDIVFAPNSAGARQATLQLGVVNQMSTANVTLTGLAIPSSVKVAPYPIAMGGTQQGMPVKKDITISNTGMGNTVINGISVTMGQAAYTLSNVPQLPLALIGGGSFQITVTFSPVMNGITNGVLTVTSNDPNSPLINVPMSGYAGPPAITLDANSVAFGNVNLGAQSSQPITITNSGFSDLSVADITVGGANPGDYVLDKMNAVGVIGAQQAKPFTITFKPTQLGQRTAAITVTSNAGNPVVNLFGSGTSSMLSAAPKMLAFPPTHVKTNSMPQMVTVSNAGNGTLKVMALTFGGKDATSWKQMGGPMAPFTVGPNASVQVGVISAPQIFGKVAGTLTIASDVGNEVVTLDGEGTAPVVSLDPGSIDFGAVPVQTASMPQTVTITNKGTDDLTINLISISGADGNDFTSKDIPQPPIVLKPNATTSFHVNFTPTKNADEVAQIDFLTDDPANPQVKIPMTGTGIQAGVTVAPMTVDFGPTMVGTAAGPKSVTLTNTGDIPITVSTVSLGGPSQSVFTVDMKGPFMIDVGAKATLMVGYSPLSVGNNSATLTINATNLVPITINLKGVGVSPSLGVSPTALDFGPIQLGMSSESRVVGIKNGGTTMLAIETIKSTDAAFSVDSSTTMLMLGPGGTTTFTVQFAPSEEKMYSGKINVTLKGQGVPIATVNATGSGVTMVARMGGCNCQLGARSDRRLPVAGALLLLGAFGIVRLRRRRSIH